MIVECGFCGAPLDVREGRRFTKCTYCDKTSDAQHLRTLEPQTPPGWRPPPVWTPPAHVPADSTHVLRYHTGPNVGAIIGAVFAITIVAVVGVAVAVTARPSGKSAVAKPGAPAYPGGPARIDPAALAGVSMKITPERLQEITGVAMDAQHSMRVPLAHPHFDAVTFRWDPDNLDHVRDFYFNGGKTPDPTLRKRFKAIFGRRLEGDSFHWEGCGLNVPAKGDFVSTHVSLKAIGSKEEEAAPWQAQSEALWKVARHVVLGLGQKPDTATVRDVLGGGYPVADLLKLDLQSDIDGADAAVRKVFPGAMRRLFIDLEYKVAIDHPWYGEANIDWKNKKGAKLAEVSFRPPPGTKSRWPDQKALEDCVGGVLGKPSRVSEGDHLGGSRDVTFRPASGGEVRVYEHMMVVKLRDNPFAKPMQGDTWRTVVTALDACGRPAE